MNYKIKIYQGLDDKQWYWRLLSRRNRKIIADGAEGYRTKGNCLRAVKQFRRIQLLQVDVEVV